METKTEYLSTPNIGEVAISEIGDNLYQEYIIKTNRTYNVLLKDNAEGNMEYGYTVSLRKGTTGRLQKHPEKDWKVVCRANVCLIDQNDDGYFDSSMFKKYPRYYSLKKDAAYELIENVTDQINKESLNRIILYQGITKGSINISYREFYEDMARTAFTQDVSYDLQDDGPTIIAFKGMRIRVLEATNTMFKYIIEKPFRDSLLEK